VPTACATRRGLPTGAIFDPARVTSCPRDGVTSRDGVMLGPRDGVTSDVIGHFAPEFPVRLLADRVENLEPAQTVKRSAAHP
jgi:hypothetical protein